MRHLKKIKVFKLLLHFPWNFFTVALKLDSCHLRDTYLKSAFKNTQLWPIIIPRQLPWRETSTALALLSSSHFSFDNFFYRISFRFIWQGDLFRTRTKCRFVVASMAASPLVLIADLITVWLHKVIMAQDKYSRSCFFECECLTKKYLRM